MRGNSQRLARDYLVMECSTIREAVSALLDGEDPGVGGDVIEAHLADCGDCRAWQEAAHEVTRRVRLAAADPAPRRTSEVTAAIEARFGRRSRARSAVAYRAGLVAVAIGELAIAVPDLLFGSDRGAPVHVAHEMGSLEVALGIGFLVAAWRPGRALGMRMLIGAAAGLLVATAVIDLAMGRTTLLDEAPHLLTVAGWLLIRRVAFLTPPTVAEPAPAWRRGVGLRALPGRLRRQFPVSPAHPAPDWAAAAAPAAAWSSGAAPARQLPGETTACGCGTAHHCDCPGCAGLPRAASG